MSTDPTGIDPVPADQASTRAIDEYFARVHRAVRASGVHVDPDTLSDLRAHVLDRVAATASPAAVTRALAELGEPDDLAAELTAADADVDLPDALRDGHHHPHRDPHRDAARDAGRDADDGVDGDGHRDAGCCGRRDAGPCAANHARRMHGRLLGVPYDLRPPSLSREAGGWWDPLDRHMLVPKSWGVGWSVNFGALAVRTGIVRPDDEDEPFGEVSPHAVTATLAAPVAVLVLFGALAAASWRRLPATIPTRWTFAGEVTRTGSRDANLVGLSALAAVPCIGAAIVHARRRPALERVGASAESLLLATSALGVLAQTVHTTRGRAGVWPLRVGRVASVALPFALLVRMSRLGRAAEQRRDLSDPPTNGSE